MFLSRSFGTGESDPPLISMLTSLSRIKTDCHIYPGPAASCMVANVELSKAAAEVYLQDHEKGRLTTRRGCHLAAYWRRLAGPRHDSHQCDGHQ